MMRVERYKKAGGLSECQAFAKGATDCRAATTPRCWSRRQNKGTVGSLIVSTFSRTHVGRSVAACTLVDQVRLCSQSDSVEKVGGKKDCGVGEGDFIFHFHSGPIVSSGSIAHNGGQIDQVCIFSA